MINEMIENQYGNENQASHANQGYGHNSNNWNHGQNY